MTITTKTALQEANDLAAGIQQLIVTVNALATLGAKASLRVSGESISGQREVSIPKAQVISFLTQRIDTLKAELLAYYGVDYDA